MITKTFSIDEANINKRLDSFLSNILDDISRGLVQQLIEQGNVLVNDTKVKKNHKLRLNDQIHVILQFPEVIKDEPQNISLDIVFENEDFYIINKQAGLTVHPGEWTFILK
jgi:23S rRNA pseudouridine1911/1915/1917 synthase